MDYATCPIQGHHAESDYEETCLLREEELVGSAHYTLEASGVCLASTLELNLMMLTSCT